MANHSEASPSSNQGPTTVQLFSMDADSNISDFLHFQAAFVDSLSQSQLNVVSGAGVLVILVTKRFKRNIHSFTVQNQNVMLCYVGYLKKKIVAFHGTSEPSQLS